MSVLESFEETCNIFIAAMPIAIFNYNEMFPKLSNREIEVLHYLATGHSSKQIAAALKLAINI